MGVCIKYITTYLPPKLVSNEDLAEVFTELSPDAIFKKSGVRKRFRTTFDVIGSDMARLAAEKLFSKYNLEKSEIDFLIFVSEGNDFKAPATAILLQEKLGLKQIGAIDVPLGCSGFTHSLGIGKSLIESGMCNSVLVLLGDTPGFVSRPDDFSLQALFSDAGAAYLLEKSSKNSIGQFVFGSDGEGAENLFVDHSGARNPADTKYIEKHTDAHGMLYGHMQMNGLEIFTFSLKIVPELVRGILEKNNVSFDDVDYFVFHQASPIILKSIKRKLKIPDEKMIANVEEYGNTVSVSIPLCLEQLNDNGKLSGKKVLVAGFGIGYSWSGTIIHF